MVCKDAKNNRNPNTYQIPTSPLVMSEIPSLQVYFFGFQ